MVIGKKMAQRRKEDKVRIPIENLKKKHYFFFVLNLIEMVEVA